jgi:tRNA/rRNA methyltransferase
MSLHNCRVVLVRPQFAANLGATARIMRNMGLTDLVLLAPHADPADRQARQLSTHGETILEKARSVSELGEAVADCRLVAATSARTGKLMRGPFGPPEEIVPQLAEVGLSRPVALVFGPESSGLTNEEVVRCHFLIHIPTDPGYPALNLAQAVAICLYELRRAWLKQPQTTAASEPAPFGAQEQMFEHLRTALEEIHFLYGPKANALMHGLRHVIGRARPTEMEVGLLHGLARQIRWLVREHGPPKPNPPSV